MVMNNELYRVQGIWYIADAVVNNWAAGDVSGRDRDSDYLS